jgi:hypothetical protein
MPTFVDQIVPHERPANSGKVRSDRLASTDGIESHRASSWSGFWWLLVVGVIALALCVPFRRSVFWLGDEGVLLNGAIQILKGSRLYADFFEFLPPGGFVITAAWFDIAGTSMLSARVLAILCIVAIACLTHLTSWQVSRNAALSVLLAAGWVIMSQGFWTQVSHHWFTTLFSMAAASATIASVQDPQRSVRWPLVAGLGAGAAAMVTPTRGGLAILAAATAFVDFRRYGVEAIAFILGCVLVPICLVGYLLWHSEFEVAFNDVILFPAKQYLGINRLPFGYSASTQDLPLKYLFPLAALLTLLACAHDWRSCLGDRLFRLCAAFGLAGFIGCFPRPDMAHIGFAAPLVCPLVAYCVSRLTRLWLPKYRYAAAAIVIGVCIPSVRAFSDVTRRVELGGEIVATPRGNVKFWGYAYGAGKLVAEIADTPSTDLYFFYPYEPMLSFLTARQQVSKYDIFVPGYTLAIQYEEACISAIRHASWLVIDRTWTDSKFLKEIFPTMPSPEPAEAKRFEAALASGFQFVAREGSFEMRRRLETIDESVCGGIAE